MVVRIREGCCLSLSGKLVKTVQVTLNQKGLDSDCKLILQSYTTKLPYPLLVCNLISIQQNLIAGVGAIAYSTNQIIHGRVC